MGRHSDSEDRGSRGCYELLASWFPGLRRPTQRRASRDESTSLSCSSSSTNSKSAASDATDEDDRSQSFDELGSLPSQSWNSAGDVVSTDSAESDGPSEESDPQERARRAAASFLQWKNKEYVPLSGDEKRAIKEYRRAVAQEEGSYMSTRAQRPLDGAPRRLTPRTDECDLVGPADGCVLMRRRSSKIRFIAAVVASRAVNVHNDALVVTGAGEEVPALPRFASILRSSSMTRPTEEPPVFLEDSEKCMPGGEEKFGEAALCPVFHR
ncbi:hypothetical protein GH5_01673 [Leishmania sp. Ghana 2012 LV757]|uniref:hypothetical protein n=1 Tax=Leishmania sp. Ghana 2012 LV757 TaxID=2803181 RepID=UPI001B749552|nr:hypothetical protein GH5_01673 [Leishmania sp. Ghana 2012 LV757]